MTDHRLDALLKPQSIALVGASERDGSPGRELADMIINSAYAGTVYPVNPSYQQIFGRYCYADLKSLPRKVDHVVLALANNHLENALRAVIEHGAKAATIYSSTILEQDASPPLKTRLETMARDAGLAICGANGMGFYNVSENLYAGIFPRVPNILHGGISYIAQSGSAFTTLCHNGCRLGFNLCVSSGNEMSTSVAGYMDWSLQQSDTRVIALFLETVRDPQAFVAALHMAQQQNIPVVVLKIGKSPLAISMALTHTGAIAGNHAAFEALCKRYGVIQVGDFDEMAAILMLLQNGRESPPGGFAAVFESGGFRELITDLAQQLDVEFAPLEVSTCEALQAQLDPGLKAENPLDAWGSHARFEERFGECLRLLMEDANVAGGAFISNYRDGYFISEAIYRAVEAVSRQTGKPIALANIYSDLANTKLCQRAQQAGVPIIDGAREALLAFKHLFGYHQFKRDAKASADVVEFDAELLRHWRSVLNQSATASLGEVAALGLFADFSIATVNHAAVENEHALIEKAAAIGYPLVLKTAAAGIDHKSDCNGVFANIQSQAQLLEHYTDLSSRLGPAVMVAQMISQGVEIALGTVNDAQFGPIIMVAAGGVLVELLADCAVAMCPLSHVEAEALLASLKINKLLDGVRGQPASNRRALIDMIVGLSQIAYAYRDEIAEIDINPVLVNTDTAVAVDALIIRKPAD